MKDGNLRPPVKSPPTEPFFGNLEGRKEVKDFDWEP